MEREHTEDSPDFKGRIYEVILTDEQYRRLQSRDLDGAIEIARLGEDDGLAPCTIGVLARCFDSEDSEVVIVPGSEITWWLERLEEAEAAEGVLTRSRQPYADAYSSYPRKAFSIPVDRGHIAKRPAETQYGTVVVDDDAPSEVTVRRDPNLHSSEVRQ
ncbi:hypothetical protein KC973_01690 [Candidatus Saccharibacteria bacterium]|nr:hypothetical protein [Candidatus Saccharibacteria bacterium]